MYVWIPNGNVHLAEEHTENGSGSGTATSNHTAIHFLQYWHLICIYILYICIIIIIIAPEYALWLTNDIADT